MFDGMEVVEMVVSFGGIVEGIEEVDEEEIGG